MRPTVPFQRFVFRFRFSCFSSRRWLWSLILQLNGDMKPEDALQEQVRRYRRMTGEQRLELALNLHELSCKIAREGIRHQNPMADEAEIERRLRQRLRLNWQ